MIFELTGKKTLSLPRDSAQRVAPSDANLREYASRSGGEFYAVNGYSAAPSSNIEVVRNDSVNQKIRAKLHSMSNDTLTNQTARILLTGHSWTDYPHIPDAYRAQLQSKYGDGGRGYLSFNPTSIPDGMAWSQSGFVARTVFNAIPTDGSGINGRSLYTTSSNCTAKWEGLVGTRMIVYYQDLEGSFTIRTGTNDAVITINGGNTNKFIAREIDFSSESHYCQIDTAINTSSGRVNIFGVDMSYTSGNGVCVYSMGNVGSYAHNYYYNCISNYPDVVPVIKPDCVLILFGTNEAIGGVPAVQYEIYLKGVVNAWKKSVPQGVGINIVSCAHTLNSANTAIQAQYPLIERKVALALGIGYVDGYDIFPFPPRSGEMNLFENEEHLSVKGAEYFADKVINRLLKL